MASSHCLKQCILIIKDVQWHSSESNFSIIAYSLNHSTPPRWEVTREIGTLRSEKPHTQLNKSFSHRKDNEGQYTRSIVPCHQGTARSAPRYRAGPPPLTDLYIYLHFLYEFCYRTYIYIQQDCHSVLVKLHPITYYRTVFLGSARFLGWMPLFVFFGLPIVSCSLMIKV